MSASLTPSPKMQFFDANGDPLVGGKLYTYAAGTTTPLATYTDSTGGTPNANPVVMNARGEASVWLGTSAYYFELKDSTDSLIWTADNITGQITPALVQSGTYQWLTSVSGTDTITAVASPIPSAYASGQTWKFVSAGANTGAVTLNISSLGARSVTKNGSTALSANDIPNGAVVEVTDDGTRLQLESVNTALYAKSGANSDITSLSSLTSINGGPISGLRNRLFNPSGGAIYQRGVAATADDAYFCDRHYILSQTGTVTPSVLTDPEDGYPYGIRITQSQASAQRFGFAQIVEGRFCKDMRGGNAILVPRIRISNSQAIRYAILGWTSTEDSVTSDVVNDWTSATFTAGNFFLGSNLSVIAVGSQTPSANVWTSLSSIYGACGSSFNNLICMVWTEGTAAQNFTLDFDWWELQKGAIAPVYPEWRPNELNLVQRFFFKTYDLSVAPGTAGATGGAIQTNATGTAALTAGCFCKFTATMRSTPATITVYSPVTGTAAKMRRGNGAADVDALTQLSSQHGVCVYNNGTVTDSEPLYFHVVAEAEL